MANAHKLYKVTFSYVAKTGALRSGAFVVEAHDIAEANKIVTEKAKGFEHVRITGTKEY